MNDYDLQTNRQSTVNDRFIRDLPFVLVLANGHIVPAGVCKRTVSWVRICPCGLAGRVRVRWKAVREQGALIASRREHRRCANHSR